MNAIHRRPLDEIRTDDSATYAAFVSANICDVSAKIIHDKIPEDQPLFDVHACAFSAADTTIVRVKMRGGRIQSHRKNCDIYADSQRRYTVNIPISSRVELSQLGRDVSCPAGSLVMISGSHPLAFQMPLENDINDVLGIVLPREFVESRISNVEDICACRKAQGGLKHLVEASILSLRDNAASLTAEELQSMIHLTGELVLLALEETPDSKSSESPVRAANLVRVKNIIRERCDNPDLKLEDIALECGLSLRYLHNLFKDETRTLREFIIYERLRRARQLLESGSTLTTNVTKVGLEVGFSNISHFSTAFRREFSASPVDVLRNRVQITKRSTNT